MLDEDRALRPPDYVHLHFLSANRDPSVWTDPNRLDIHRERRPHLALGSGRHSCIGMNITGYASKAFLRAILGHRPNWHFDTDPQIRWRRDDRGPTKSRP